MDAEAYPARRMVVAWAAVAVVDAFLVGQGFIALLVGVVVVLGAMIDWVREAKSRTSLVRTAFRIGAGILLPVAVLTVVSANCRMAARRAEVVVAALERFHADTGAWPGRLQELCPRYLPGVPSACWRAFSNEFVYVLLDRQRPMLWYVELPPFAKRTYRFPDRRWEADD
jgi:hypothetical protein